MNLWTFVLLGFLAHSCSGNIVLLHRIFTDYVCSEITSHLASNEGSTLPLSDLPGFTGVVPTVTGLASLQVAISYQSNDTYRLDITGPVSLNSANVTGLVLGVNVNALLRLVVTDGYPCLIVRSFAPLTEQLKQTITRLFADILNEAQGAMDHFISTSQQLFQAKMEQMVQTGLNSINAKSRRLTTPVKGNGYWGVFEVNQIVFNKDSLALSVGMDIKDDARKTSRRMSLGNDKVTDVPHGAVSVMCISGNFISGYLETVFDSVLQTFKKNATSLILKQYNVNYTNGSDVSVSAKRSSAVSCSIKSSGSSVSISLGLQFSNDTGFVLLEFEVDIQMNIEVTRSNNKLKFSFKEISITNKRTNSKGEALFSRSARLLSSSSNPVFNGLNTATEGFLQRAFDDVNSGVNMGIKNVNAMTPSMPSNSTCSPSEEDNMIQCVSE